jgi:hypothetical protein
MSTLHRAALVLGIALLAWAGPIAQVTPVAPATPETAADYQGEAAEQFLTKARIVRLRAIAQGVTGPGRATLQLDGKSHDAVFKDIEFQRPGVTQLDDGVVISNMEDNWRFEVAAYQIDRMIGLGMVPATVEREYRGKKGSLQWWVQSEMSEAERARRKVEPPNREDWNQQQLKMRLFDALLYNWDRHTNNILITKDFQLRLIDHSRAFLDYSEPRKAAELTRFSRSLLAGIEKLTLDSLKARIGRHIEVRKLNAILQRRDKILDLAKKRIADQGEAAVLYP